MEVPEVFNIPGARFVFMDDGSKYPPCEAGWQLPGHGHTYEEALAHPGNVGLLAGFHSGEDLVSIGLDQDKPEVFSVLSLPPTTTWETRPGRLGMQFVCSGVPAELMAEYGKPADYSQFKFYKDGLGIGELKLERCYQVIPNSWKTLDSGEVVSYQMVDSRPPVYIDVAVLLHSIMDIPGVSLKKNGKGTNPWPSETAPVDAPIIDMPVEPSEKAVDDEEARRLAYSSSALLDELNRVETAPVSTRYDQVYASGCALGELIGGGLLDYDATARALVEAGEKSGLPRHKAIESARNGIEKGMKNPRKMPKPTTKADSPPPFGCPGHKPEEWFDGCYYGKPKTEEEMFIPGMSEEEFGKLKMPEGPKLTVNLPPDHFLTRMMGYGLEICDAYVEYWFLGGLFMLAVASDKKVKYELSSGTIYMNFYIYLLGLSTLARKSTVVQLVEDMLLRVLGLMFESAKVPTEFSAESFIEHMHHNNHAAWVRDEAAGVISVMKKDYMRGFKEHLMQLYDCRKITRKLRTSERKNVVKDFKVNDPFLNLLFASTDAALAQNMEPVDTQSGFIARFMFGFPRHANPNYRPLQKGTPAQSALADVCINQLRNIAVTMQQLPECYDMVNSEEAQAYWAEWGEKRERHYANLKDGYSSQIMGRMNTNALKLAMSFEVGSIDFDVTRPIRLEFMVEACRVIDTYFIPTSRAVYDIVGNQDKLNHIAHMLAYLARKGGHATKNEVMRDEKIESKKLNEYLDTMLECGQIVRQKVFNVNTKRNTEYLVLVDNQEVEKIEEISIIGKVGKVDEINTECPTLPILPTPAILPIPVILEEKSSVHGVECTVPDLPRPERERFMSDLKKHVAKNKCTCHICGHVSDHELVPDHSNRDYVNCYICTSCLISHRVKSNVQAEVLAAPSPQTSLSDVV